MRVRVLDPTGFVGMMQVNHLQPPFDNPAIRRALWAALDQTSMMQAVVGPAETSLYHVPLGFFAPGTPMASDAGFKVLTSPPDAAKAKELLASAGFADGSSFPAQVLQVLLS